MDLNPFGFQTYLHPLRCGGRTCLSGVVPMVMYTDTSTDVFIPDGSTPT